MAIQAEADNFKIQAEAGATTRELQDALVEYTRLHDEAKAAHAKAKELVAAAQKYLADSGKDEHEAQQFIDVRPIF
jgi:chemotaxis regulatin CheY-phosphate phosphatase CheZ